MSSAGKSEMPKDQHRKMTVLLRCLNEFQELNPSMPIQIAASFLLVAMDEGKSLREYQEMAGVPQSTMSRHLLDLADRNRMGGPGMGLIQRRQDPMELRKNIYTLTPKGAAVVKNLLKHLDKAPAAA